MRSINVLPVLELSASGGESGEPIQAFLKFSDGSNDPAATGISDRISVQGCH